MPKYQPVSGLTSPRFSGIRTFARLPHVNDLTGVDFAVVGVPFDTGATFRVGGRFGPSAIRGVSHLLRRYHRHHRVGVFDELSGIDYGDLPVIPGYAEASTNAIVDGLVQIMRAAVVPVCLGGDHYVAYPHLLAASRVFGPVGMIQFDSHTDLWDENFGQKHTHATPIRRAIEAGAVDTAHSIVVGLRGSLFDAVDLEQPTQFGIEAIPADEMHEIGMKETVRRIRERVRGARAVWITFDIDFIDPAFAPGTGTPEIGGFSTWETMTLIRGLVGVPFAGFDVVEVIPANDGPGEVTALAAANLVFEMLSLLAVRKRDEAGRG